MKPFGSLGRQPPNTAWLLPPSSSTFSASFGGSIQSGLSSAGSPTGPELKTQNGICRSALRCFLRKWRASPRHRFM